MGRRSVIQDLDPADVERRLAPLTDRLPSISQPGPLPKFLNISEFEVEIRRLWGVAQDHFLQVGRLLNRAKETVPHGEFMPMVRERLPFSHAVAHRLMAVAKAADHGALNLAQLPPSYMTAYEVLALTAEEREQAEAEGVIRPNMRHREIVEFRRRVRSAPALPPPEDPVEARRAELRAERDRLRARLAAIEAELGEEPAS